jgi:DNA (cytosine-5)-methyltransferase 1
LTQHKLTFGSLFAGIGGFDLGFERAGFECKWQVEIDDYATRVLERHWPNAHRQKDIKQCGRHNLGRVDCIIGGFPCQDISYAGKRAGIDGARSGLFFEAIRVVRELQPRAVVLENVAGLLTRGLDRVLGTLAEVGFDAEWHCIPAASVGAPHIRDRVFVFAYRKSKSALSEYAKVAELSIGIASNANGSGLAKRKSKDASRSRPNARAELVRSGWWQSEPNVDRVANGIPARVDRLRCLGNAIVPQVAEVVARMTLSKLAAREITENQGSYL